MSEAEEAEEEAENTEEESGAVIDPSELTDDQLAALTEHPEVRKMLTYEETSIPQVSSMLNNLINPEGDDAEEVEEAYNLLVEGIADRSGRVTESTVEKVLTNFVEEYNSVK